MTFTTQVQVRFAHVDAAGIVFYPRYIEMLNGAVEEWFASLGFSFNAMHLHMRIGVPTVKLECEFLAPSELGDVLCISIVPTRLGNTSCAVDYVIRGSGVERVRASGVLVCVNLDTRTSMPWPEKLRAKLLATMAPKVEAQADGAR